MGVCKFFLQGHCRFGDNCYNEHVGGRSYNDQYRQGGRQPQPVQANKFSFRASYEEQVPQRQPQQGYGQQQAGGFSFTKTFQTVTRQESFGNQAHRNVSYNEPQPQQYRYQQQQPQVSHNRPLVRYDDYDTPKPSFSRQTQGYNAPQPQNATSGFSFTRAFNEVQPSHGGHQSFFGGQSTQPIHQGFGVSEADIDMDSIAQSSIASTPSVQRVPTAFFGKPIPQNTAFGQATHVAQSSLGPGPDYSEVGKLSAEELESFKADTFVFGKIPMNPPPLEVC